MRTSSARSISKNFIIRLFPAVFAVVVLCVFGLSGLRKVRSFLGTSLFLSHSWSTNIVFNTDPVVLASFTHDANDRHQILLIPANLIVKIPYGYGLYPFGRVWKLSQLESRPELVSQATADLFHRAVDGWVNTGETVKLNMSGGSPVGPQLQSLFSLQSLVFGKTQSNLQVLDRLLLWWNIFSMRSHNSLESDFTSMKQLYSQAPATLGISGLILNDAAFLPTVSDRFEDVQVRKDGLTVKVFNTTSVSGIGQNFGRFINAFGGKVIAIENKNQKEPACQVVTSQQNKAKVLVLYLERSFDCSIHITSESLDADVYVMVGKAFADRWK